MVLRRRDWWEEDGGVESNSWSSPPPSLASVQSEGFGLEEALPDTYGLRPEVLADVLNDLREKHALR